MIYKQTNEYYVLLTIKIAKEKPTKTTFGKKNKREIL